MARKSASKVTTVVARKAADTKTLITNGSDAFPEDSFAGTYWNGDPQSGKTVAILEPSFKPGTLKALVQQNNILAQCIETMEVNIDGTGHKFVPVKEGSGDNEKEKTLLENFFDEPFPGKSMIAIRRALRRDLEDSGNAYMEVIRNVSNEVMMLNHLEASDTRLLRMDDPVPASKILMRGGVEVTVKIRTRERRFVQTINGRKVYFKEFGASRHLDRSTGQWADGELPLEKRASEIIHFTGVREAKTPYGSPRWINQLPSVLGSRKAEEHNLDFFDSGGLPPVLVLVQGGTLGETVREDLIQHLSGAAKDKHRAAVVEAASASGTLESAGSVQVRVERFGAERQSDAMFQTYDKNAEEHVRVAFRLPPMFVGRSQDYNFATALTAYMTAEAQVFAPERTEFDEIINKTILRALGIKHYKFKSLPITLTDAANQLKALELSIGKLISGEDAVTALNEITGLSLKYTEPEKPEPPPVGYTDPLTGLPYKEPVPPQPKTVEPPRASNPSSATKSERFADLLSLANGWAAVLGISPEAVAPEDRANIKKAVASLSGDEAQQFNEILAAKSLAMSSVDMAGLGKLCSCATALMES